MNKNTPDFAKKENEHLASAQNGNADAFSDLVAPYRRQLLVHCYRLSGSLDDAEDIVQETFIRAWTRLHSFLGTGSFRNWLYTIATRLWLDGVRQNNKQVLLPLNGTPADPNAPLTPPATAVSWLDPLPDTWLVGQSASVESAYELKETVSLAFMVALQQLNPPQRVVLLLRAVFHWPADEVAELLGLSVASVNNHLYRARKTLEASQTGEAPLPKLQLDRFVTAWESGDLPALVALLHENATFAMPPMDIWFAGQEAIRLALQNHVFIPGVRWKLRQTGANGRAAWGLYQQMKEDTPFQAFGLLLPSFSNQAGSIVQVTAFLSPDILQHFQLPQSI